MDAQELAYRRVQYQARRGLKELDFYLSPYVKSAYLQASADEQADFAALLMLEDPELLLYFLGQKKVDKFAAIVKKVKAAKFAQKPRDGNNAGNDNDED